MRPMFQSLDDGEAENNKNARDAEKYVKISRLPTELLPVEVLDIINNIDRRTPEERLKEYGRSFILTEGDIKNKEIEKFYLSSRDEVKNDELEKNMYKPGDTFWRNGIQFHVIDPDTGRCSFGAKQIRGKGEFIMDLSPGYDDTGSFEITGECRLGGNIYIGDRIRVEG